MSQKKGNTSRGRKTISDPAIGHLARQLSLVLNNPLTPVDVYNAVADAVTPLRERIGVKSAPEIDSPAYVERALRQRARAGLLEMS
jgi:hypothetical protein